MLYCHRFLPVLLLLCHRVFALMVRFNSGFSNSVTFYGTFSSIFSFAKITHFGKEIKVSQSRIVLRHTANNTDRKPDYLVDLEKSIKTERIQLTLGNLIGLVRFRTFLTMEKYYKRPVSLLKFACGKRTLKQQTVPTLNLPIKFNW